MAMTDAWRQPLRRWRAYFERWIELPRAGRALMLTAGVPRSALRLRPARGPIDALRAEVVGRAKDNKAFSSGSRRQRRWGGWGGGGGGGRQPPT